MKLRYKTVGFTSFYGQSIAVTRDQYGKFHIDSNARPVQKRLTAEETVRWFLNSMEGRGENQGSRQTRVEEWEPLQRLSR